MFDFIFKKQQLEKQNTLVPGEAGSARLDNFISFSKSMTEQRRKLFDTLIPFVLQSDQWSSDELKKRNGEQSRALVFNFSQEYVMRYLARLFPRNSQTGIMELGVKVRHSDRAKREQYEKEIFDVYRRYDISSILLEQGLNYLTGGSACLFYPPDPITKRAILYSLDPREVYLGWAGGQLVQFAYRSYVGNGSYNITYWDLACRIFKDGATGNVTTEKNDLGFIPVSWIPNFPRPHLHEGNPLTDLLYHLDKEYNEQASNLAERVGENTQPHFVVMSDKVDTKNIERGGKKITRLGSGDDAKYLTVPDGGDIITWLEKIEKRIQSKTGIVNSSGEVRTHISGASLSFQYSDMMDLIGFMRLFWDKGFRALNNAILTYKFGADDYQTDPIYQPFLQQDAKENTERYKVMLDSKLITHVDAIDELRGVENAEEKWKEILAEEEVLNKKEMLNNADNKLNNKQNGQEPN